MKQHVWSRPVESNRNSGYGREQYARPRARLRRPVLCFANVHIQHIISWPPISLASDALRSPSLPVCFKVSLSWSLTSPFNHSSIDEGRVKFDVGHNERQTPAKQRTLGLLSPFSSGSWIIGDLKLQRYQWVGRNLKNLNPIV